MIRLWCVVAALYPSGSADSSAVVCKWEHVWEHMSWRAAHKNTPTSEWMSLHARSQCVAALSSPSCLAVSHFSFEVIHKLRSPTRLSRAAHVCSPSSLIDSSLSEDAPLSVVFTSRRRACALASASAGSARIKPGISCVWHAAGRERWLFTRAERGTEKRVGIKSCGATTYWGVLLKQEVSGWDPRSATWMRQTGCFQAFVLVKCYKMTLPVVVLCVYIYMTVNSCFGQSAVA